MEPLEIIKTPVIKVVIVSSNQEFYCPVLYQINRNGFDSAVSDNLKEALREISTNKNKIYIIIIYPGPSEKEKMSKIKNLIDPENKMFMIFCLESFHHEECRKGFYQQETMENTWIACIKVNHIITIINNIKEIMITALKTNKNEKAGD